MKSYLRGEKMQRFIFWVVGIAFFVIYFIILRFIYDEFVPMTPLTDVLSLFIIIIVILPLSAVSAQCFINLFAQQNEKG